MIAYALSQLPDMIILSVECSLLMTFRMHLLVHMQQRNCKDFPMAHGGLYKILVPSALKQTT